MAFSGFGLTCSEAEVRRLIGYSRLGVALRAAQANLAANGARAQYHNDWSVDDLRDAWRAGRHPIVGVERQLLGYPRAFHAVVLVKMTSTAISVLDPLDGPQSQRYGPAAFALAWEAAGREVLVVETPPQTR